MCGENAGGRCVRMKRNETEGNVRKRRKGRKEDGEGKREVWVGLRTICQHNFGNIGDTRAASIIPE